ncbi:MAG: cytochrome c [Bacteroidota bacterium]
MKFKSLSWILLPLLLLLGLGIWSQFADVPANQSAGRRVYLQHCANCHMEQGQGLAKLMPPLAKADYLQNLSVEDLSCIIRYGQKGPIVVNGVEYDRYMPGNDQMTAVELHALVNYVRMEWGGAEEKISFDQLNEALGACEPPELDFLGS